MAGITQVWQVNSYLDQGLGMLRIQHVDSRGKSRQSSDGGGQSNRMVRPLRHVGGASLGLEHAGFRVSD